MTKRKPEYKNYPLEEIADAAEHILRTYPRGTAIYQKWTCAGCGDRVTGNNPNEIHEQGHHEDCGHITDMRKTGCNYSVHTVVGGLASTPAKGEG